MSTSPSFPRIAKNNVKSTDNTVEDNNSVNRVNSTFGIPYRVLKLVGSIISSRQ